MPAEGVSLLKHSEILTFDEIVEFTRTAVGMGVKKVRITGGEPLVRKGIVDLVKLIAGIDGISDFSMTTNGILLKQYAEPLFKAGIKRINISMDTLDEAEFFAISRGGNLRDVIDGILLAKAIGFKPIKLNCVVNKSSQEPNAITVKRFAVANALEVRFIPLMDLDNGIHGVVEGGDGGNCASCNRIRLTPNGIVKPCLFNDIGFSVRELGPKLALERAIDAKPRCGSVSTLGEFYNVGG